MLAAASEEGFVLLHEAMHRALGSSGSDPEAQALAVAVAYVRFALDHTPHFRLMFGHGSPPKSATTGLQRAAGDVFQLMLGIVARCLPKRSGEAAVKALYFRVWALGHGIATLAIEKQILFDVDREALIASARDAIARQLSSPRSVRL
jgi:hypothetical protein